MPKTRKRKTPITCSSKTRQASSSNPSCTRDLIRKFHVLLKKQAQLQGLLVNAESAKALVKVDGEIEDLGGLAAYQRMSSIGQGDDRGGGSQKVLIQWLRELGMSSGNSSRKLKYVYPFNVFGPY
jgi:25S rRNA (adenine2142-N1)-methyltransferase